MRRLDSLDDLFEYASILLGDQAGFEPVELGAKSYCFKTTVSGESWDNCLDVRHARYVQALQQSLEELYIEAGASEKPLDESPLVRVRLERGSSDMWPELFQFLSGIVTPMTDVQTFITIMTGIAGLTGCLAWGRHLTFKSEKHRADSSNAALSEHEETKRRIFEPLIAYASNNPGLSAIGEKPVRSLVASMGDNDTISFDEKEGTQIPRADAKKSLPRSPRSVAQTSYADGEYLLEKMDYSQGELVLYLAQDGISVRTYTTELSTEDTDALFKDIMTRQKTEELPFSIAVQVNVRHTPKRIQHGSIMGLGPARSDKSHRELSQILQ